MQVESHYFTISSGTHIEAYIENQQTLPYSYSNGNAFDKVSLIHIVVRKFSQELTRIFTSLVFHPSLPLTKLQRLQQDHPIKSQLQQQQSYAQVETF